MAAGVSRLIGRTRRSRGTAGGGFARSRHKFPRKGLGLGARGENGCLTRQKWQSSRFGGEEIALCNALAPIHIAAPVAAELGGGVESRHARERGSNPKSLDGAEAGLTYP
jgi:hypothetical protein